MGTVGQPRLSPGDTFARVVTTTGELRVMYRHYTNSISGQQSDFYWEWVCSKCGARFGDREVTVAAGLVLRHGHRKPTKGA